MSRKRGHCVNSGEQNLRSNSKDGIRKSWIRFGDRQTMFKWTGKALTSGTSQFLGLNLDSSFQEFLVCWGGREDS